MQPTHSASPMLCMGAWKLDMVGIRPPSSAERAPALAAAASVGGARTRTATARGEPLVIRSVSAKQHSAASEKSCATRLGATSVHRTVAAPSSFTPHA